MHPNKHIRAAIEYALGQGWRVTKAGPRAHIWGRLWCPHAERDGCRISVLSTPRNPEGHARRIRREVDACPHEIPLSAMHRFRFILNAELTEEQEERLAGLFDSDLLSGVASGIPYLDFEVEGATLGQAIQRTLRTVQAEGASVKEITIEPDAVLSDAAA